MGMLNRKKMTMPTDFEPAEQFAVDNANTFRNPDGSHTLKSRQLFLMVDMARTLREMAPEVDRVGSLRAQVRGASADVDEAVRRADNAEEAIAEAKAIALDEASAELNRRLVAEMDGNRKNESTTRRISFGQGVQLGKRVLRELAAAERNYLAGGPNE